MKITELLFFKYTDIFQTFSFLNVIAQRGEWATFRITCCVHTSAFLISTQRKCKKIFKHSKNCELIGPAIKSFCGINCAYALTKQDVSTVKVKVAWHQIDQMLNCL